MIALEVSAIPGVSVVVYVVQGGEGLAKPPVACVLPTWRGTCATVPLCSTVMEFPSTVKIVPSVWTTVWSRQSLPDIVYENLG
jgi:hypothetical protein